MITKRNKPNVTIVIGKVKMTKIGFKMAFNNPKTMATMMAPVKPATSTPGSTFARMTTATAVNNILIIRFISLKSFQFYNCFTEIMLYKLIQFTNIDN